MSLFDDLHDFRCTVPDCATCEMLRGEDETLEQWHARIRAMADAALIPDECRNGHPSTPENTYMHPDGWRICRVCKAEQDRAYRRQKVAS